MAKIGVTRMPKEKPSTTVEDYLHAIYSLSDEGELITAARLARRMGVSPPTAWATVQRMVRDGLLTLDAKKIIHFTHQGRPLAERIVRRHRLAERFLTDILGLDWAEVHDEAHRFEHGISPRVEERIVALLGEPTRCPHGSPIPGSGWSLPPDLVRLTDMGPGEEAVVEFVSEELEEDRDLLLYLQRNGIRPDERISLVEILPSNGVVIVRRDGQNVPLGLAVASRIRVRRLSPAS